MKLTRLFTTTTVRQRFRNKLPPHPNPLPQRRRGNSNRSFVSKLRCHCTSIAASLAIGSSLFAAPSRPNIVVVLVDDMGFSDLGCYGGEIHTPNLDKLAGGGVRFTQFHNTARCCPSRAALLTGLYPHQAGVGHMTEERVDAAGKTLP